MLSAMQPEASAERYCIRLRSVVPRKEFVMKPHKTLINCVRFALAAAICASSVAVAQSQVIVRGVALTVDQIEGRGNTQSTESRQRMIARHTNLSAPPVDNILGRSNSSIAFLRSQKATTPDVAPVLIKHSALGTHGRSS